MRILQTLENRISAANQLLRVKAEAMTRPELDLAMGLLLHKNIQISETDVHAPLIQAGDAWLPFSPTTCWMAYGEVVSNVGLVVGAHEMFDDEENTSRVTGHWYSCHGYFGGVKADGYDLREVVGRTCALLLANRLKYGADWGHQ